MILEKGHQRAGRQFAAAKSERNAVSDKRIDETSSVAGQQHVAVEWPRFTKDERRRVDRLCQLLPIPAPFSQGGILLKHLAQGGSNVCSHHRASVDPATLPFPMQCHGLNTTVAAFEKVKVDRRRGIFFRKMCFHSQPLMSRLGFGSKR